MNRSMMLEAAMMYLEMGWGVYPAHTVDPITGACSCGRSDCPCPGKHPMGRWIEFQNRRPTKSEVKLWFSSMACNIGTITGQISGIVVVDVDGEAGIESIRDLGLEPTLTAHTGGGGYHLFYSTNKPALSHVRALDGVDIRGDGGYVILPPSLHHSGRRYEWLEPAPLAIYDPTLFDRYTSAPGASAGWHEELLKGVEEGSRSITAAKLAGRYFGMGLSGEETWILMSAWNERNNPPLLEHELMRTVKAIQNKHLSESAPVRIRTFGQIMEILSKASE